MADGNSNGEAPVSGTPRGPRRLVLIGGAVAAVVVLATIGAVGGWLLAAPDKADPLAQNTPFKSSATTHTATPPVSRPARTADRGTATATDAPPGQIVLPDLVGKDFEQVRRELRARRLGWQLVFGATGDDREVERTEPRAGTTIGRGTTVKVYVRGAAPPATLPGMAGMSCTDAAMTVVEHGLYPDYPSGKVGRVLQQDPEPPGDLRWNDRVKLYCGRLPGSASTSATP